MSLRKAESHSGLRPSLVPPGVFFFLLIFLYLPAKTTEADCSFPAIFNFGDSNSDTGGFWAAFPAQRAPFGMTYFKKPAGRASDGRAVIDFLAQALGLPFLSPYLQSIGSNFSHGANFATASSTVLLPSLFVTGISPFSLAIQLNQMNELRVRVFEMSPQDYLPSKGIFAKALYTFDIGQNDFAYIGIGGDKQFLSQVANQIAWTIKELYNNGGRTFMTQSELQNASVIYVDTHSVKLEVFQHPKKYGFIYGTKACCGSGGGSYNYNPQVFCGNNKIINGINVTASACSDPQNYVSWDGVHATEATNKIIIRAILSGSYFDPPFPLSHLCNLKPIC
ncbi:GDSL esterase/lipase At4g01130-like isoform X2 [Dendrobium catenatum]|uniref:GDSL esterase/lipase At4g01130-like isoform X2 n=1 Tax=Dendrobium catenatum TaxID=906689 RepID=UPI00109EF737|nr:GDSL esterase/lipase At4g01130-like isoform X2 [Dendrobium catenatum]